ncbi:MAG: hypothetical protein RQ732_10745 [Methylophaga sp.]|nr:hypothetical protein [Methylophaga sp.]
MSDDMWHVVPIDDLREHESNQDCWCSPSLDDGVFVHNSLDQREKYEAGEIKLH